MDALVAMKLAAGERAVSVLQMRPGGNAGELAAVALLEASLAEARALGERVVASEGDAEAAVAAKRRLKREVRDDLAVVATLLASAAARQAGLLVEVRVPRLRAPLRDFIAASRVSLSRAREVESLLERYGLPDGLLDIISTTLTDLAAAEQAKERALSAQVTATAGLARVAGQVMQLLRQLDVLVRYRLRGDPAALVTWQRARRLPLPPRARAATSAAPAAGVVADVALDVLEVAGVADDVVVEGTLPEAAGRAGDPGAYLPRRPRLEVVHEGRERGVRAREVKDDMDVVGHEHERPERHARVV